MRQVWIPKTGAPDVLEVREAPDPTPGPGEVLIAVEAAGVNFADVLARQGIYPDAPPLPAVVGYEVGGTVAAVGAGVEAFAVGDSVLAMTRFGGYTSHLVVPAAGVWRRPDGMSAAEGAAIPVNYLTAFQMMIAMGGMQRRADLGYRQRVLVHGASGGVGTACADLGLHYGVELFGTASPGKHDYVRERGYDHAIDYRNKDFVAEVARLTDGRGVDLVLDPVGGAHWGRSLDALGPSGRMVVYGISSASGKGKLGLVKAMAGVPWVRSNPVSLLGANHGVIGVNVGHLWGAQRRVGAWMDRILALYAEGVVKPHVDREVPFAEAAEAHRHLEGRHNVGKTVLTP